MENIKDPQDYCEEVHDLLYQKMGFEGPYPVRLYTSLYRKAGKTPEECATDWFKQYHQPLISSEQP